MFKMSPHKEQCCQVTVDFDALICQQSECMRIYSGSFRTLICAEYYVAFLQNPNLIESRVTSSS